MELDNESRRNMSHLPTVQALYQAFGTGDVPVPEPPRRRCAVGAMARQPRRRCRRSVAAAVLRSYAVLGFFAAAGQMEIVDLQILNMMEGGDEVAVSFVLEAKLPHCGGRSYRDEEIHLWTFNEDGKVARLRHYVDTAKHIAAFSG